MSRSRSRRDAFEEYAAPPPRSYPPVSLRENNDRPVASSSKAKNTLQYFREHDEGRRKKLEQLFESLQSQAWHHNHFHQGLQDPGPSSSPAKASSSRSSKLSPAEEKHRQNVRQEYLKELYRHCCDGEDHETGRGPTFDKFQQFVEDKEEALWNLFNKIDVNNDMLVDTYELQAALAQADIKISAANLNDMVREMDRNGSGQISFADWRDYLLLLPRQTSLQTVYNYWASFSRPRLATSIATQDLDVLLAEKPSTSSVSATSATSASLAKGKGRAANQDIDAPEDTGTEEASERKSKSRDTDDENKPIFEGSAMYLLAGGLAGAVSRTATAPFDRLKVYLINHVDKSPTSIPNLKGAAGHPMEAASKIAQTGSKGVGAFASAVKSLYVEGGVHAFFIGNGLNIIKIFPESAVKFWSYEYSKRWFARNVDRSSVKDISGSSRFIAGGIGGVVSQLLIYPLETWKTRVMSSTSSAPEALRGNALYGAIAKDMWKTGGLKAYYKGLNMGLIGVFPYSAIDMSLFAAFKKAYAQYTGDEEPGPLGSLTFGALSGGLGATSVYPLNLLRTRMQTQGTRAHPQRYTGWRDVASTCYRNEGIRGFYKGLSPTLLKVSPSMGISWVVYEYSTALLFPHPDHQNHQASNETQEE